MKHLIFGVFILSSLQCFAQPELHCATDEAMKKQFSHNSGLAQKLTQHEWVSQNKTKHLMANTYTIPVVFHILHLNGAENISDIQVIDALHILNRDYAKQNPDTIQIIHSFKNVADSTGLHFVLATKDPVGNCTNGIVHYYDTDADWNEESSTLYSHTWNSTMYLNVYIVRTITLSSGFGAAGYTYFPGTFSPGDNMDAIIVLNNYFGSIGTGSNFQSRVLTHEVGHWLNLSHVFGFNSAGQDCTGDDFVADTPPTPGYLSCPDVSDTMSYRICDSITDENFQNYMDYSYCCKMFTHEQGIRMRAALNDAIASRDNLWSTSNLIATGVLSPTTTCAPIADFKYSRTTTCTGVPVTFTDASWNGLPTMYNWSFPGGTPSTSSLQSPTIVYNTNGVYSATLTTSNLAGTSLPITKTNIVTVVSNNATNQGVWTDGFEGLDPQSNGWLLANSSGGVNWEQTFDADYSGVASALIPSANNTRKSITSMTTPSINLSAIMNPELSFAVATYESNPAHINNLKVEISTDCEQTWQPLYSKTGNQLITTTNGTVPFIPTSALDWRLENIALSTYSGASSSNIRFTYTRDTVAGASNIYLDDINVSGTTDMNEFSETNTIKVYPNPSYGSVSISLYASKQNPVKIDVLDISGSIVFSLQNNLKRGINNFIISENNSNLKSGLYLLNINRDDKTTCTKLVIL